MRFEAAIPNEGTMKSTMRTITIALLTTLATLAPSQAQDVRFRDAAGRVTGSTRTDSNGVTTFHDASGSRHRFD